MTGILVAAVQSWIVAPSPSTQLATLMFVVALVWTLVSAVHTHVRGQEAGENFAYGQVVLDALLVTGIIHVTGGAASNFAPLYVLVIGEGALLLPFRGGMLVGGLASILYVGDIVLLGAGGIDVAMVYQVALFALVALVTGFIGDRLRRAGVAVGAVESELRQLRHDTAELLENIATGVLTVDGFDRVAYLNQAGAEMLGVSVDSWAGRFLDEVVSDTAPGLVRVVQQTKAESRSASRLKVMVKRPDGLVTLGLSTALLGRKGDGPPSVTVIFQDISDVDRLETLNRRAERLEAVAELSASLAHEIKNPLASIRSSVEQLGSGRLADEDRALLEDLVLRETDRLSRLLSQFLEFSGLTMGDSGIVDLASVARECVALVEQHPECVEGVEIALDAGAGGMNVEGDGDLIHRALFNLILNGVQFSAPEGQVRIAIAPAGDRPLPEAKRVRDPLCITVEDTGPGIVEEEVGRIFNPFFTTRTGGSGLGLAVVHRAVEVHDGAIVAENRPEGGARFVIFLPRASGAGSTLAATAEAV